MDCLFLERIDIRLPVEWFANGTPVLATFREYLALCEHQQHVKELSSDGVYFCQVDAVVAPQRACRTNGEDGRQRQITEDADMRLAR